MLRELSTLDLKHRACSQISRKVKIANKSLKKNVNIKCEQRKSVLKALKAS